MSRKPEAVFEQSINSKLPSKIYQEKAGGQFRGGTPDRYYEGPLGNLFVEYKYLVKLPASVDLGDTSKKYSLSALQQRWLQRAYHNSVRTAVILGVREYKGGIIFPGLNWDVPFSRDELQPRILSASEIANWIATEVRTPNERSTCSILSPDSHLRRSRQRDRAA